MNDILVIVEPMIPALRRYARSLVGSVSDADDLVQDCLERVLSRWQLRRADGDARTWVFTILHHLAMDHLRKIARRGGHHGLDTIGEASVAIAPSQDEGLRYLDLMSALRALPEEQRAVVLLISVEDLTYAEAALVLNVPVGTVMSRLSRARARLLATMAHNHAGGPFAKPVLRSVK